jgi:hypothetical protein
MKEHGSIDDGLLKLVCGGSAAIISKSSFAPFERVRLLMQTRSMMSPQEVFRQVRLDQGIRSLWRGNFVNCARVFPTHGLRFALMDKYQQLVRIGYESQSLPLWRQMLAGKYA